MNNYATSAIRNIGLFSHGGAGKTTLAEAFLFNSGVTSRLGLVDEGNSTSDYDPEEVRRRMSIQLSLMPFDWKGSRVNVIDSPGFSDFIGEIYQALTAVDTALILIDAAAGVEIGAELVWRQAEQNEVPRFLAISKIDRENADFDRTLEQIQERFGRKVVALQIPIGKESNFQGVVDLASKRAFGADGSEIAVPADLADSVDEAHEKLVEAVAENDDDLLMKYLEGEPLEEEEIRSGLRQNVHAGLVIPVVVCSALQNHCVSTLMDAIVEYCPSPADRPAASAAQDNSDKTVQLKTDSDGPLAALVFKTTADPYVGKLTYFRVLSGTIKSDSHAFNSSSQHEERLGQLFSVRGKTQEPVAQIIAGDIGAVAKLQATRTGDTLCSKDDPLSIPWIDLPAQSYFASLAPKSKADLDKMSEAISRMSEEDLTIKVSKDQSTGQTILAAMGELHADVTAAKMKNKLGVEVELSLPNVPYRETVQLSRNSEYKHKKQSGGHGQYGHVYLEIEPLPRNSGFEFANRIVGGVVPKQYIPAVEKGVVEALADGVLGGFPVVDLRVTLYDGSFHAVDSSEIAFKIAGQQALRNGMSDARPALLEPIMRVHIDIPDQYVGDVLSDLNTRRGRVLGMNPQNGVSTIEATVPMGEMLRYSASLRALTQGRGVYQMAQDHYEAVPAHIEQDVIAEAKQDKAAV
jgi:elongation factor G